MPPVWSSAGRAARPGTDRFAGRPPTAGRTAAGLLLALYRSSRRTDALEVFDDGERILDAELGPAPSPELTALRTATRAQAQEPFLPGERRTVHGAEAPRPSRQPVRGRARHRMRSPAGSTTDQAG
ncbi:BTAD domain-containing putative transcriptional regulator [Streptomyces sp. NBC_00161]|uniref:BTAD domain-containing putative transcriptional regulator n=1 Tax=Streptomyces sp. NBC_00161 TaxID=2975671 RepID=UPI00386AF31A